MAAPTAPTLATITDEGLNRAGISSPSSASLAIAEGWVDETKNDIWMYCKKLRSLQTDDIIIISENLSEYSFPTDLSEPEEARLLHGGVTGTAQAGAAATITLAAAEDVDAEGIEGHRVLITSGTAAGEISQCTDYNTSTKVATVSPAWGTQPDNTSVYMVVDTYYPIEIKSMWSMYDKNYPTEKARPTAIHVYGDADYGEFQFNKTPDDTYGLELFYYANLMTIDLAGTLMATLYQRWESILIQGVLWRRLLDDDDDRYPAQEAKYNRMLSLLIARETYGVNLSETQIQVLD